MPMQHEILMAKCSPLALPSQYPAETIPDGKIIAWNRDEKFPIFVIMWSDDRKLEIFRKSVYKSATLAKFKKKGGHFFGKIVLREVNDAIGRGSLFSYAPPAAVETDRPIDTNNLAA